MNFQDIETVIAPGHFGNFWNDARPLWRNVGIYLRDKAESERGEIAESEDASEEKKEVAKWTDSPPRRRRQQSKKREN